jgi:hypothetical protein
LNPFGVWDPSDPPTKNNFCRKRARYKPKLSRKSAGSGI